MFAWLRKQQPKDDPEMDRAIEVERERIRQASQIVASGSRVMQNMAGAMRIMAAEKAMNDG